MKVEEKRWRERCVAALPKHERPQFSYVNDHSFSKLPAHIAPTCPKGQSAWAMALRLAEESRSVHKTIDQDTPLRSLAA